MLREMHVRDLALIREARLEFGPGLNVLTGETGAGKTVLVEALGLLLGGRGDSGMVRPGAERLEVEAAFDVPDMEGFLNLASQEGLEVEEGEVILRRVLGSDGRGRCYVNGKMCTLATLSRLGEYLVDIHGQHEHQRLLRTSTHLEYLDDYGPPEHAALLESYRSSYSAWREASARLKEADMDEAERLREIDLLRYQVREIESVSPREGELEDLLRERKRMQNREALFTAVREAYAAVAGDGGEGALDLLGTACRWLEKTTSMDEATAVWAEGLLRAQESLSEYAREMRAYLEALDFQPGRLEEVESRLRELGDLSRKYGRDAGEVLAYLERARERLANLENLDVRREDLRAEVGRLREELERKASELSASRRRLAENLTRETNRELAELNMAGMRFRVRVENAGDLTERGRDLVEFEVTPGRDMPYRPLARIASGGELSRITLALKLALARADAVPTLVFDEIDAGIGGTTADVLAEKLSRISRFHQVFSVTHLPQIAAFSDVHLAVSKRQMRDGVYTEVGRLEGEERVEELVRMLGGDRKTAREHAVSMLERRTRAIEEAARARAGKD